MKTILSLKTISSASSYELLLVKLKNRNLVKNSIFVILPWLFVFAILLSFNDYYFDEPFTLSYSERPFPPDYKIDSITSFFKFDIPRLNWWLFYSVSLIPDTIKDVVSSFPELYSDKALGNLGIGIFATLFWISSLSISLIWKKKRKEIIVSFIFALTFLLFYSGSYLHNESYNVENYDGPSAGNQTRHMLPILSFSLMLFVFIIQGIWGITRKISFKSMRNFSKFFIYMILILFVVLLVVSVIESKSVKENFKLVNPEIIEQRYPINTEVLGEKSIIVGGRPGASLEYNSVAFFSLWEYMPTIRFDWDPAMVPQGPIQTLKEKITEGYDVYVFKNPNDRRSFEITYYWYLASEHNLILKEHSDKFCKMELTKFNKNPDSSIMSEVDSACYSTRIIERGFALENEIAEYILSLPEDFEGNLTIKVPVG